MIVQKSELPPLLLSAGQECLEEWAKKIRQPHVVAGLENLTMKKIPNHFDLRSLEVFVVTAEQGGMTQSGKALGMTQSAVSQIISSLESGINVKLFDRSVRPIALTASGRNLYDRARQILKDTKEALRETQTQERRQLASLTVAMSDSLSVSLGPLLYQKLDELSGYWRFWSGLSPFHRADFLAHNIDIVFTSSNLLEDISGVERHLVFQEPYVLIFPKDYKGNKELHTGVKDDLPFLRISFRSAMGLRIERQLGRLRVKFPDTAEFDRGPSHAMAVANGMGWGVTSPLCLLEKPDVIEYLQIVPITKGGFSRQFELLAREGSLGEIPSEMAAESSRLLKEKCVPILLNHVPWLEDKFNWDLEDL